MFSLRWKILLWFFVNLLALSVAAFVFLRSQLRLDFNSLLAGGTSDRLEGIAGPLAAGLHGQPRGLWPNLLEDATGRWRSAGVRAGIFRDDGSYLAGEVSALPAAVRSLIEQHERRHHGPMPWQGGGNNRDGPSNRPAERGPPESQLAPPERRPPPDEFGMMEMPFDDPGPGDDGPPDGGPPSRPGSDRALNGNGNRKDRGAPGVQPLAAGPHDKFILRARDTGVYWVGIHLGEMEQPDTASGSPSVTLILASKSLRGGGLLFDYYPWLAFAVGLVVVSALIWLPFVTGVIGSLRRMMRTAEDVAQGRFRPAHVSRRGDELGRLSRALAHMGVRLEEAATGHKRFLGDTAHELLSPLARMEMALSILEHSPLSARREQYTAQAHEDVRFMSTLVQDLLAFAKAGLRSPAAALGAVSLGEAVNQAVTREAAADAVVNAVPDALRVRADSELLSRALANTIRNAVRYAGHAGPVIVTASEGLDEDGSQIVAVQVSDRGPGVPPAQLDRLFEPFFRPETARARETGGAGLGLAIVKSCVEACRGRVAVRNLAPTGLQVTFELCAAGKETP